MPTTAFDVLGTVCSLDAVEARLRQLGAPPCSIDLWLANALHAATALALRGDYAPFHEVLGLTLPETLLHLGLDRVCQGEQQHLLDAFAELDPDPEAEQAARLLHEGGHTLLALTNGAEDVTWRLLERGGLAPLFGEVVSCDLFGVPKPHPRVYESVRARAPGEDGPWLIAAHTWDVAGAAAAGLRTVWVGGPPCAYPELYPEPDVIAPGLAAAARDVLARSPAQDLPAAPPRLAA